MSFIFVNGEMIAADRAVISAFDQGFLLGHGIFETVRVENGTPLAFQYHFERFAESAKRLDLEAPGRENLETAISELLSQNEISEARLRITLTGGEAPFPARSANTTLVIATSPLPKYSESAKVVTVPFTRNENSALCGIKSLGYGDNLLAMRYAIHRGADEAVFANNSGHLCEGATTNVFVIIDGQIFTPPLSSGCLPGVTRRFVIELCKAGEIPASESSISLPLHEVDFAFLTSSLRGLQPIERFDDEKLPVTHPLFKKLRAKYEGDLYGTF